MHKNHTGWLFLIGVVLIAGACSDGAPVNESATQAETAAKQPELPVREWYPTPKHAKPRIAMPPQQPAAQMPITQQSSFNAVPVPRQQWNMPPQSTVTPQQYQYAYPYQYDPRPWGGVPYSQGRQQPDTSQNNGQQGTTTDYWGVPVYRGGQYNVYPAPGMPGYVW